MADPVTHPTPIEALESTARPAVAAGGGPAPVKVQRLTMVALVVAPLLTLVADLVQASPADHDTRSELESIAAHPTSYQVAAVLGFCALVLYVPALLALARPLWSVRPWVAVAGLGMSVTGTMALASLMGSGPVSLAMSGAESRSAMVRVTDAYESSALTNAWVLLMILGFSLGPIVLGVALWRSGFPWVVPALLVAGLVVQMADAGRWPLAAGYALTAAGQAAAAVRMWRMSDAGATHAFVV